MSRSTVNFLVDLTIAALLLLMLAIASIVHFIFPPGTQAAGWTVWGMDFDTWSRLEAGAICLFALGILVHLIYHWNWVCGFVAARLAKRVGRDLRPGESAKTLYGVTVLVIVLTILGAVLTAAQFSAVAPHAAKALQQ